MPQNLTYPPQSTTGWVKTLDKYLILFLFALSIFLSFNHHSKDKFNTYHDVLWADAAGYYSYLPGLFITGGMSAEGLPADIHERTGDGFFADEASGLISTKYTYGVAFMQSPFFLVSHLITKASDETADGYTRYYQKGIMLAALFYTFLGLVLLRMWLTRYFPTVVVVTTIFAVYAATNLFYYTIDKSGMAHAYSFCLFAAILVLIDNYRRQVKLKTGLLLAFVFSLAVLIRPTAIVLLPFIVLYNGPFKMKFTEHLLWWTKRWKHLIPMVAIGVVLLIPQLIYWKALSGNLLSYTYGEEGFTYLASPHIFEIIFSPKNGLIFWTPLVVLMFFGIFLMIRHKRSNVWGVLFVLLVSTYLFASWWNWTFGCSFGARSFIEYYVILAIPLAWLFETIYRSGRKYYTFVLLPVLFLLTAINVKMVYFYDDCYYASTWDFEPYLRLLTEW